MRLAVIEDEPRIAEALKEGLEQEGYAADLFGSSEEFERAAGITTRTYRLILLDIMLPGRNGIELCRVLRAAGNFTPVMMLTARGGTEDKVEALDSGSDDYLVKPVSFGELLARVRALLRRPDPVGGVLSASGVVLDFDTREVSRDGTLIPLTAKEFDILAHLMKSAGRAVSREDLLAHIWGESNTDGSNIIDVHTLNLRRKIDNPYATKLIRTIRGVGYTFTR